MFHELEFAGDIDARVAKALDPDYRQRLRDWYDPTDLTPPVMPIESLTLTNTKGSSRYEKYELQTFGDIAAAEGAAVTDIFLDLAAETRFEFEYRTGAVTSWDADYTEAILRNPVVLPGTSDGGAHVKSQSMGHYGTEMITWMVRDTGRFGLEEMHQQLSQRPAQALGLIDRGDLTEGKAADIVIYDYEQLGFNADRYETVNDLPGGDWRRVCRATGYRHILVNGEVIFNDNECTGATPGQLLSPDLPARRRQLTNPRLRCSASPDEHRSRLRRMRPRWKCRQPGSASPRGSVADAEPRASPLRLRLPNGVSRPIGNEHLVRDDWNVEHVITDFAFGSCPARVGPRSVLR